MKDATKTLSALSPIIAGIRLSMMLKSKTLSVCRSTHKIMRRNLDGAQSRVFHF